MSTVSTLQARRPPARQMERAIPIAFAIAFIAITLSALLVWRSLQEFRDSADRVSHTQAVLQTMEQAFSSLNEAIADVREYVITEEPALLTHRDEAVTRLNASLE